MASVRDFDVRQLVADAALDELPALAGRFREGELLVELRLRAEAPAPQTSAADQPEWITPEEAAAIARLPMATEEQRARSRRRIYGWAAGAPWAKRASRKCLRVDEDRFRRWPVARG